MEREDTSGRQHGSGGATKEEGSGRKNGIGSSADEKTMKAGERGVRVSEIATEREVDNGIVEGENRENSTGEGVTGVSMSGRSNGIARPGKVMDRDHRGWEGKKKANRVTDKMKCGRKKGSQGREAESWDRRTRERNRQGWSK